MNLCYRCGKTFSSKQSLLYHLSKKRIKCTQLKCNVCRLLFTSNTAFETHKVTCNQPNDQDTNVTCNQPNDQDTKVTCKPCKKTLPVSIFYTLCPDTVFIKADKKTRQWVYVSETFDKLFYPTKTEQVINKVGTDFISRRYEYESISAIIQHSIDVLQYILHLRFPNNPVEYRVTISNKFHQDEVYLALRI